GDFDLGFMTIDFSVSNSISKQRVPHHLQMQFQIAQNGAGFSTPTLENPVEATWDGLLSSAQVIDGPTDRRISRFETLRREITEEAQEASLNFNIPFGLSQSISGIFKFGGKYVRNFRDNDEEQTHTDPDRNELGERFLALAKDSLWTDFGFEDIDRNLGIRAFLFEDPDYDVGDWLDGDAGISDFFFKGDIGLANQYKELAEKAGFYLPEAQESTQRDYTYERNLSAFYASAEVNFGKYVTLFPGIRYENFAFDYTAFEVLKWGQLIEDFDQEELIENDIGEANWFPQLQLRVKPTSWLDIRLAATKSIIYPDYRAVSPYIFINTFSGPSMNLGNPALQPALANNFDAYASIFENKLGLFTAGYFYKEIDNLIVSSQFRSRDAADINDRYQIPTTQQTAISTWINLEGTSTVKGFELDWQTRLYYLPGFLKGIVLSANYTHLNSETSFPLQTSVKEGTGPFAKTVFIDTTRSGRMPNQPDDIFNFTIGYDIGGFSARLSYQFTDNILVNTNRTFKELDSYTDSYKRWDFTAYQKLPWLGGGLQVYANVSNLTNTPDRAFTSELQLLSGLEYYGRTVDVGLRYSFE
nr:TonB-dependent receptor [Saprospiraceae bacterium]